MSFETVSAAASKKSIKKWLKLGWFKVEGS